MPNSDNFYLFCTTCNKEVGCVVDEDSSQCIRCAYTGSSSCRQKTAPPTNSRKVEIKICLNCFNKIKQTLPFQTSHHG